MIKKIQNYIAGTLFTTIASVGRKRGEAVYLIGGNVRDLFLNRPTKDIDFVVIGNGIDFARDVATALGNQKSARFYGQFGTAMIRYKDHVVEFVGARKESYQHLSRKPEVSPGTLADDQNRRDFTINSLAISLNEGDFGELIDPFGGLKDLANKVIRTPLNPDITYSDDPLRMMRAIRFATQLGFNIQPESLEAIKRNKNRIRIISVERITDELNKIILSNRPSAGFLLLEETELLPIIFPQLAALKGAETINGKSHKEVFRHTLEVLDNLGQHSNDLWLRWAALLHDIAKPATKRFDPQTGWTFHGHEVRGAKMTATIFRELKLPLNEALKFVQKIVLLHLRPIVLAQEEITDSAIRRLLFDAGDDIDALMMLCEADITTKNEYKQKKYRDNFQLVRDKLKEIEEKDRLRNWQPPVDGQMIMDSFGIKPGREVGLIKTAIREAILDGIIGNNFEEAFAFMKAEGEKLKLVFRENNAKSSLSNTSKTDIHFN